MALKKYINYYRCYLSQAWTDTKKSWVPGVISMIVVGIAAFLFKLFLFGQEFAVSETKSWVVQTLVPALCVGILFFLWNLFLAPPKLTMRGAQEFNEEKSKLKEIIETKDNEIEQIHSQRAVLELRFERRHPYWWPEEHWYRIGIYNSGRAVADNVEVWLENISPSNPMPSNVLPSRLGRKGGQTRGCRINPQSEDYFDVIQFSPGGEGERLLAMFHTEEQPQYKWFPVDKPYILDLKVTAANADFVLGAFAIREDEIGSLSFHPEIQSASS